MIVNSNIFKAIVLQSGYTNNKSTDNILNTDKIAIIATNLVQIIRITIESKLDFWRIYFRSLYRSNSTRCYLPFQKIYGLKCRRKK